MSTIMRKEVDRVNQNPAASGGDPLELMHAIVHLYRSQQLRCVRAGSHELGHMEIRVLGYFSRHPGATSSDLVTHSGRDKAQVARLIRGLRDDGLLDAVADAQDKRITRLSLSAAGQDVFAGLHRQNAALAASAQQGLSEAERASLMALLERIRANLGTPAT